MASAFFSFTPSDFGIQGGFSPPQLEDYDKEDTVMFNDGKGGHLFSLEDKFGEMNTFSSENGFYQDNKVKIGVVESRLPRDQNQHHDLDHQQQQQKFNPNFLISEDYINLETISSSLSKQAGKDHQQQQQNYNSSSSSLEKFSRYDFSFSSGQVTQPVEAGAPFLASLELLNTYGSAFRKLKGKSQSNSRAVEDKEVQEDNSYIVNGKHKLSTEEVMRVAGARYVQYFSQGYRDCHMSIHPFGYALSGLCEEETRDIELAHLLLAAAEKVGYRQFETASSLLKQCEWSASYKGTLVQRVVCNFSEALHERIQKETGQYISMRSEEIFHYINGLGTNLAYIACHQEVPFHPVLQFAAIQAMLENVANERRIHLIDLEIRFGTHWTGFMEALAEREECPVELLTITSVGVRGKQNITESGERLASLAKSLNLPFKFKEVIVSDMQDIKDHLFYNIEDEEAVIVYAPLILRTMIPRPRCMENLMRVIRNIRPSLMVVIEVEANHNSPSFVNRFIDALFYYSAFFDCLETCMKQEKYRVILEGLLREGIRNIVAAEGSERVARSVKMDVWRTFFARYRMVEMSFSKLSVSQAELMAKKVCCTTLDRNGKSLTVGWKGTPIHSLSAWKFR